MWRRRVQLAAGIEIAGYARHAMIMDFGEGVGRNYGVPWAMEVDELHPNSEVGAVHIAVPHHLHTPLGIPRSGLASRS